MTNLAVIPARSGSKGLKDKNIRELGGMPLMAHTIRAANQSGVFDEVLVSTDSEHYADVARKWGASAPFLRGSGLSNDSASSWDVVRFAVAKYRDAGREFDTVALLQPTSPLRTAGDIVAGYQLMAEKDADVVVSVCEVDHSPLWCNTLPGDLSLDGFIDPGVLASPRQSLPTFYRLNGALYILRVAQLMSASDLYGEGSFALVMTRDRSVDIDDEIDFLFAEQLFNRAARER